MTRRHVPTPQELFDWAAGWTERASERGDPQQYPTIRQAARRFCCRQREIDEILDGDLDLDDGYLGKGVGFQAGGLGGGHFEIEAVADYVIEAYRSMEAPVLDTPETVVERIGTALAKPGVSVYPLTLREWSLAKRLIGGREKATRRATR